MEFTSEEIKNIEICPWCSSDLYTYLYTSNCEVVKCQKCGMAYARQVLNEKGRKKYWTNYCDSVHLTDTALNDKRQKMYEMEYKFITGFFDNDKKEILDIGCSKGEYLDVFAKHGWQCFGIEYDEVARSYAKEKYTVWSGDIAKLKIEKKFNLITIRGTMQYFLEPRTYFEKLSDLLSDNGLLYISASPNADSLCFNLYKERFSLPVCLTDYYAYNEKMLTEFFAKKDIRLLCDYDFYEQTPYCDLENDIVNVANALEGKFISNKSPAFYHNMLTLVYKKESGKA